MCWRTSKKKYAKLKIAEDDIPVFKIVNKDVIDGYYKPCIYPDGIFYSGGKLYLLDGKIEIKPEFDKWKVNEGFHSYSRNYVHLEHRHGPVPFLDVKTNHGNYITTYTVQECIGSACRRVVMNCVIPKGTVYCENQNGQMVSEALRVVGFEDN